MSSRPRSARRRSLRSAVLGALAAVLLLTGLPAAPPAAIAAAPGADREPRTWVVDAVDDLNGNRFVSQDTGTSTVTVQVGDTVEWRFVWPIAGQEHDLTSQDTADTWDPAVQEYRAPDDPPIRYTFTKPGTYDYVCSLHGTVMHGTVVVQDPQANRPPTAEPVVDPRTGRAPLTVHFTANGSDPDGDSLTYEWDFGTGDSADRSTANHAMYEYTTPGLYTATLVVSDGRGGRHEQEFPITVNGPGEEPVARARALPTTGPAPLDVAFTGTAHDEQGGDLSYAWDFGDGTTRAGADASHTYAEPGAYTATLTVTDGDGNLGTDTVAIVATDGHDALLPRISATATPRSGTAPLDVALSTEVSTGGQVKAFAAGLASYPDLTGTAQLVRRRGQTYASLDVTGLKPNASHQVHVHEQACTSADGGAHFRFDETRPFAEVNEIWLPFTSDAQGRSGLVEVTQPQRAGAKAVSLVVHDPDNPARRIGCVDFAPSIADLAYDWDFGDGTTGTGADPDHTYTGPGRYTARVTVSTGHAGHGPGHGHGGHSVTATTEVVVAAPADSVAPQTRITRGPSGTVRADHATFGFTSSESGGSFACRLDGGAWRACASPATFRGLREGPHRLQVRASDAAGNTDATPAVRRWTVDTTGPVVRGLRPAGSTRDRTPTVRARVTDRHSAVRRRDLVLRVDGRVVGGLRYDARRGRLTWTPRRALTPGRHAVRLVAVDAAGNRTVRAWRFQIRR